MKTIVIIEDEVAIREELELLLQNAGYHIVCIQDFNQIVEILETIHMDLILLDISLPIKNGFIICAEIRKHSNVPIIFVTSRDTPMDELTALNLGGDDYITKPYNVSVLIARIQALLRRTQGTKNEALEVKGLILYLSRAQAEYKNQIVDLTPNETKILYCLMGKPNQIVPRMEMIEFLWDNQIYIDDNTLSVNIGRLRTKLNEMGLIEYIVTKRGLGYRV